MAESGWQRSRSIAQVLATDGTPVGAAFLVTSELVLTAAHVVNLAAGRVKSHAGEPPAAVTLKLLAGGTVRCSVARWLPPSTTEKIEDIAGLRLSAPAPRHQIPARLSVYGPGPAPVSMLGFPEFKLDGIWSRGRLVDIDGRGLAQIDTDADSQFRIQEGFSGTPVWDGDVVSGMVLEGWRSGYRGGFMVPAETLLNAWPELRAELTRQAPFRGLRSFREQDAGSFFGREALIDRVVELAHTTPVTTVVGPSGVGKSSLLHAGAVRRLRSADDLAVAVTRPGEAATPVRSVARALVRVSHPDANTTSRLPVVDGYADALTAGRIGEVVGDVLGTRSAERLVLVLDQAEEVFTADEADIHRLAAVLTHSLARNARLNVLLGLRADFLGRVLARRELNELGHDSRLVTVGELGRSELREAVTKPVERSGVVRYEPGLVDRLLEDVGAAPGRLPLVQFLLRTLWENQENGWLTHGAYDRLGGIDAALANHAEHVWHRLPSAQHQPAQALLSQLMYPLADGLGFVSRPAQKDQLSEAQWAAAQRLSDEDARLVVHRDRDVTGAKPQPVAELSHETLITHWPRLTRIGEEDRAFREWQEGLRRRLRQWTEQRQSHHKLLSGADIREASSWQRRRHDEISEAEIAYIERSRSRRRRRRITRTVQVSVLVAVLLAAGLIVWNEREQQVSATAADTMLKNVAQSDPYQQLRQVVRAYRTSPTETARKQVARLYEQFSGADAVIPDYTALEDPTDPGTRSWVDPPDAMASKISADGRIAVTTDPAAEVTVWQLSPGAPQPKSLGQIATRAAISRDGRYITYLESAFPGSQPYPPGMSAFALSRDHTRLACFDTATHNTGGKNDGDCVYTYDTLTGHTRLLGRLPSLSYYGDDLGQRAMLRFDPDGSAVTAAVPILTRPEGGLTHRVELVTWDLATGKATDMMLPETIPSVTDLWVAPGGRSAALVVPGYPHVPGTVLLTTGLSDPGHIQVLTPQGIQLGYASVSLHGNRIAALTPVDIGADRYALHVWDLASWEQVASLPITGPASWTARVALDADGSHAMVYSTGTNTAYSLPDNAAEPFSFGRIGLPDRASRLAALVPLGVGISGPVAVVDQNTVSLFLPRPDLPAPLARTTQVVTDIVDAHPDQWATSLDNALASDVEEPGALDQLPAGAYTGALTTANR